LQTAQYAEGMAGTVCIGLMDLLLTKNARGDGVPACKVVHS